MTLVFGSVCSGIEAASVAWLPLGIRCAFMADTASFPRAVLKHHYPDVPLRADFTQIQQGEHEPIDILIGGTPCQSFSVAGLRGGMADERGNLAIEYLRLADRLRPRWLVWENVPGVLSSNEGRDFGSFVGGMVKLGYGFAYRVLDAQYVGLAQRRKRVFVVGYFGDWRRAAAVLFEPACMRGDPAPRRKTREGIAPTISSRPTGGGGLGTDFDIDGGLVQAAVSPPLTHNPYGDHESREGLLVPTAFGGNNTSGPIDVATARSAHAGPHGRLDFESETFIAHALRADGFDASEDGTGRGTPLGPAACLTAYRTSPNCGAWDTGDRVDALTTGTDPASHVLAFALRGREGGAMPEINGDGSSAGALRASSGGSSRDYIAMQGVRRLTPMECERLQGFPDGYTAIPVGKKGKTKTAADGPRYKALGNSFAVPVVRWIGQRILAVNSEAEAA